MTDSTTEKGEAPKSNAPEEKMVPVAALAGERAQKRAAREEAEAAKAELAQVKDIPNIPDDVIQTLAAEARKMVDQELAPWKDRAQRAEMGVKFQLNETQVAKVMEIRTKNPTLTDEQAFVLARAEHADAFRQPAQSWNRQLHGGLPVTGTSDARTGAAQDDYTAMMHQAASDNKPALAKEYATKEFVRRMKNCFNNRPI